MVPQAQQPYLPQPAAPPRFRGRRITFMHPVRVQFSDRLAPVMSAHATNLSLGGMFIYSLTPPQVGSRVKIALEVRGRALLLAEGEVRWVRGSGYSCYPWCPGFGVRFINLPPKSLSLVHHLVTTAGRTGARKAPPPPPPPARELQGIPVPAPQLPEIVDLDEPLDEDDFKTKQMFPIAPLAPVAGSAPGASSKANAPDLELLAGPRPFSTLAGRPGWGGWRWLRWGLALVAAAGWMAAFFQARPTDRPERTAAAVQVVHPSGVQR